MFFFSLFLNQSVNSEGEWESWLVKVPSIELEGSKVDASDLVIPTIDTIRHESLLLYMA